ncbi:MAG: iron ABC transporter permease [Chloroflexota bacterium]
MLSRRWLYPLPLLFLLLFYFYPLAAIFGLSFAPEGQLELAALQKLVSSSFYWQRLWFTTWQATLSTALTLLLALPGAYVFARYDFPGKTTLRTLSTLPFVLPTVVVANAFTALLGSNGVVNGWLARLALPPIEIEQTIWMILLAHVFYNYSVALRIISGFWQNLSPALAEAAQMLGASPRRAFWAVTLPLLWPAVSAAAVLVFIFTFTSFGVVLILGGPRFATLEVEIYRQARDLFNLPVAAALSLVQIVFTFVLMVFYTRTQARLARPLKWRGKTAVFPRTPRQKLVVASNLALMLLLLALPLLALLLRSFTTPDGPALTFYRELFINRRGSLFFVAPGTAVFNSTAIALTSMALAVTLGLITAHLLTQKEIGDWRLEIHHPPISNLQSPISQSPNLPISPHPTPHTPLPTPPRSPAPLLPRLLSLLDPLFMLPLATSAVTLGFGYIIALNKPPLNLRSSLLLVPIAHTLVGLPFVIRAVLPALRAISPSLREAAAMLGADPARVWRFIDWPLIRRAVLVGAVFAFTVSMGEFGATLFIARPQTPTMPVAIFRFLSQPGAINYGQALAMSSLLMLVCAVGFVLIERFRVGDEGEF